MRAFGPFANEQVVNFTAFGETAFFLIHGPTGSGKTSILDAICFALYGVPSVSSRDVRFIRSQQSAPDAICEVEFIFQVGPHIYFIKRQPAQTILKKGTEREIPHKVEFCEVDPQGNIIGERLSKIGDVDRQIEHIVGFNAEQFRQVVILPQGEFRKLLFANSSDKEKILEKLFNTGRYKQVEFLLKLRNKKIYADLTNITHEMKGLFDSVSVNDMADLQNRKTAVGQEREQLGNNRVEALRTQKATETLLKEAQALSGKFDEMDAAINALVLIQGNMAEMEATRLRVEQATRALNIVDLEDGMAKSADNLSDNEKELVETDGELKELEGQQTELKSRIAILKKDQAKIDALTAERTLLVEKQNKLVEYSNCENRRKTSEKKINDLADEENKLNEIVDTGETRLKELTRDIETLVGDVAKKGEEDAKFKNLSKVVNVRRELEKDELELVDVVRKYEEENRALISLEKRIKEAGEAYDMLYTAFINGQAALLAKQLETGSPCPVCGSKEHPALAHSIEDIPSEVVLEQARLNIDTIVAEYEKQRGIVVKIAGEIESLKTGIKKDQKTLGDRVAQPVDEIETELIQLKSQLESIKGAEQQLIENQKERKDLQDKLVKTKKNLLLNKEKQRPEQAEFTTAETLVCKLRDEIGSEESDANILTQQIKEINAFIDFTRAELTGTEATLKDIDSKHGQAIGKKESLSKIIKALRKDIEKINEKFAIRLTTEGFKSAQKYQSAKLSREEIDGLRNALTEFDQKMSAAKDRRHRAETECTGATKPDLQTIVTEKERLDNLIGELQERIGSINSQLEMLVTAEISLKEREAKRVELEKNYAITGRLAEVVGGQNSQRMTLQRYVLAALFDDVSTAASQRLSMMSRGRYHLSRSESLLDARGTGGLDLNVTDFNSGEQRPTFTLSGGESFLASLSLALGLSDVVLAQSGGRYLDTIFVDEGFGTLDPETLDLAMDTLIELYRQGRTVGVISHVSELRERISSRIEVSANREGSTVTVIA